MLRGRRVAAGLSRRFPAATGLLAALIGFCVLVLPTGAGASFPGVNGPIFFTSDRGGSGDIYRANADGTGLFRLTHSPNADDSPAVSAEGTEVAFVSFRDGRSNLYLMRT